MTSFSPHKPLLATQLIGRATPLATLHEALQIVPQRRGACVLLAGEAGIGKSRLTAEARMLAQQNGFAIVQGNCYEPDHTLPYAP
jgi:predicted ATPase